MGIWRGGCGCKSKATQNRIFSDAGNDIFDHRFIFVKTISFSRNEMATAAMRFGHSLINGVFTLVKDNGVSDRSNNLTELFFDSDIIYRDGKMSG